jgi:hypothetical protein
VPFEKVATRPEVVELFERHKYVESPTSIRQSGEATAEGDDEEEDDDEYDEDV